MQNWVQEVITKWRSETVKLNTPAIATDIEKTEAALNFKFPEDFREFYLVANGFEDYDWQEHMFSLWPLERIIEEYESEDKRFIGFCDFFTSSLFIGFNKIQPGIFKIYNLKEHQNVEMGVLIAQSFEEVIGMINSSSDLLY